MWVWQFGELFKTELVNCEGQIESVSMDGDPFPSLYPMPSEYATRYRAAPFEKKDKSSRFNLNFVLALEH